MLLSIGVLLPLPGGAGRSSASGMALFFYACRFRRSRFLGNLGRRGCSGFPGCGRSDEVGVVAPVDPYAGHGNLLAVEPHSTLLHTPFGQLHRQLRIDPAAPISKAVRRIERVSRSMTQRSGGGGVGFLFDCRLPGMEKEDGAVQGDASDGGLFVLQVGSQPLDGQQPGRHPQFESRRRIPVAGCQTFDFERPDNRLLADQRPGSTSRAIRPQSTSVSIRSTSRICAMSIRRGIAAGTVRWKLHSDSFRDDALGFAHEGLLHGGHVERGDAEQQQQNDCKHSPKGIFEDFFTISLRNYVQKRTIKPIVRP